MNAIEALRDLIAATHPSMLLDIEGLTLARETAIETLMNTREALSTPPSEAEGWKLVPIDLTDDMAKRWFGCEGQSLAIIWRAVLAAAPAPTEGERG